MCSECGDEVVKENLSICHLVAVVGGTFLPFFFFFNDTATTEIYTLSLHDALPISCWARPTARPTRRASTRARARDTVRASLTSPCATSSPRSAPCSTISASQSWSRSQVPPMAASRRRSEEPTSELQSRLHTRSRPL